MANNVELERYELNEPAAYRFTPTRREVLSGAGAGLLVWWLSASGEAAAQRRNDASAIPLQARLHIAEDGIVTILNGKVEEGQGPRTELAMAAAEELGIPLDQVRVQMADTEVTPDDWITAGSRSTPTTVPGVRKAAAATRQLLAGAGVASYAELAKSPKLAEAYKKTLPAEVQVTPASEWKLLGTPHPRLNGRDIVTGAHQYPSDLQRPGMLYGTVLRRPSYGATLAGVDLTPTLAMKGVKAVRDGEFVGCVAPTAYAARKAVETIAAGARWNTNPHPSSTQLYEHLKQHAEKSPTISPALSSALEQGRYKVKAEYRTAYIQHAPMEPRAAVAEWKDGRLTVWTGTSNPFGVRAELMEAFRLSAERVRVIVPDFGGGFGGKHTGEVAIEAARLAREADRPVSLRWTRAEEFSWAYFRPAALIEIEAALDESKSLAAWKFLNYNAGPSAIDTPYRVGAKATEFIPTDSPLRQGSYRGLAATANNFARECAMDELAHAAQLDPLELRLAHLENPRLKKVLEAAAERFRWSERRKAARRPGTGIGLACGTEKGSYVAACVALEMDAKSGSPKVTEICEAFECGAILNPLGLRSQVEGSIIMGLGAALREEVLFAAGKLENGRFSRYKVPRFSDIPRIELVLLDRRDLDPAGAGETPIMAVAPAIGNAVFDATGKRVRTMPIRL